MATKYYAKDANTDGTCNYGVGTPYDLATSTGTPTTHTVDTSGIASWTTVLTYDLNIGTGLMAASDSINFSISLNSVSNSDVRLWVQYVSDAGGGGCGIAQFSGFSSTWTTSGTQTGSVTIGTPLAYTPDRIRLLVDAQRNLTHGTREVIVDVESSNTWIEGPWGGAGPTTKTGAVI